jgi:hypothetical protein
VVRWQLNILEENSACIFYLTHGGRKVFQNTGIHLSDYTVSQQPKNVSAFFHILFDHEGNYTKALNVGIFKLELYRKVVKI